jgi:hypothetical protein
MGLRVAALSAAVRTVEFSSFVRAKLSSTTGASQPPHEIVDPANAVLTTAVET